MKPIIHVYFLLLLILTTTGQAQTPNKREALQPSAYLSLTGKAIPKGNPVNSNNQVLQVTKPLLRIFRNKLKTAKGTVLIFPGGSYEKLDLGDSIKKITLRLSKQGFNVILLDYHLAANGRSRDLALQDALKAFRLLKNSHNAIPLAGKHLAVMGIQSGGHLAARMMQSLNPGEQPDNLALISPAYLNEKTRGTVFPAIVPPVSLQCKLYLTVSPADDPASAEAAIEYAKTWRGYDGQTVKEFPASSEPAQKNQPNPAAIAVEGYSKARHEEKLSLIAKQKFDLVMLGNSITNNFEKPEYQPIWQQFYVPRKALNLGFSGYRTENLLWNIQHGELEGQSPKVLVLEIGTNNVDEKNYPTRHTAGQLAGGIEAIIKLLRQKLPNTKLVILRCFPGAYGGPNPTSHRAILERASDIAAKLADGKNIFYCDINHLFLNFDGSINAELMPDYLHPNPAGSKLWAQAMEPLLSSLMEDQSRDTDLPKNSAVIPVSKLENDSYNWWDRHSEVLRLKDSINPEIVLIGNSITHFWGGLPKLVGNYGHLRAENGPKAWNSVFSAYRVLNLGFGWDRTQNALWRLDHGEIDGLHPRIVIVDIGTNNTSQTEHARMNTASEIVEGIRAVCLRLRSKLPAARIILMDIFPREKDPSHPRRQLIREVNKLLEEFARNNQITTIDLGPRMLHADGTFLPGIMLDYTHPSDKGYQIWADALRPLLQQP